MKCPVCGQDCIQSSDDLVLSSFHRFNAYSSCQGLPRDKRIAPLPNTPPYRVCGKRSLDDVFFQIWLILVEEGVLLPSAPLYATGIPHPFMVLAAPPHFPPKSMILLTHAIDRSVACRLMEEVPKLHGIVRDRHIIPGLSRNIESPVFHTRTSCRMRSARGNFFIPCR